MKIQGVVFLFVVSIGVIAATSMTEPVAVVPDDESFLELEVEASKTFNCKKGFRCPIVDGVCCAGGNTCCPFRCKNVNATKIICLPSDSAVASKMMSEALAAKRQVDKQQQALANEQEEIERKHAHIEALHKEKQEWKDNLARERRAQLAAFNKEKNKILAKLESLAKKTGKSVKDFLPSNFKKSIAKKKEEAKKKKAAMSPGQRIASDHDEETRIKPAGAWTNYHKTYDVLRVQIWRDLCMVSGMVSGQKGEIGRVPSKCRPKGGRLVFSNLKDNRPVRIDILPDGRIFQVTENDKVSWVSLAGISYSYQNGSDIFLKNGWTNYAGTYQHAHGHIIGGLCIGGGVVTGKKWGHMAEVDPKCKPEKRLILSANNNEKPLRLDVLQNGTLTTVGSNFKNKWISLSNVVYMNKPGQPVTLLNGWQNHQVGKRYRKASYNRVGNVVVLSGVVKPGKGNNAHIGTLPPNYRPLGRLVFGTNHHERLTRIDVGKDGKIMYVFGRQLPWIALDGISFYAVRTDSQAHDDEENAIDVDEAEEQGHKPPKLRHGKPLESGEEEQTEEGQRAFDTQAMGILEGKLRKLTNMFDPGH